jgi:hypothetical protein
MNIGQNPNTAHNIMKIKELHTAVFTPSAPREAHHHAARRRGAHRRQAPLLHAVFLIAALSCSTGLASSSFAQSKEPAPSKDLQDEARKVLGPGASAPAKSAAGQSQSSGKWCIALASLRGVDRDEATPIALEQIRTRGQLPAAFADRRANATIIAYGQYDSAEDPQAIADLKRIREIQVDGQSPYILAILSPPPEATKIGGIPEYNLLQAKRIFGDHAVQSLQVAVYGREDLKSPTEKDLQECRDKAEEYCLQLRQEGEMAFYYHGQRRSMVTIGVFDTTDYDPQVPGFNSARLLDVKKRHPYNLYNGAAIREKRPGQKEGRLQPSTLVKIPDPPIQPIDAPAGSGGAAPIVPGKPSAPSR